MALKPIKSLRKKPSPPKELAPSTMLTIFDVPIGDLIDSSDNPNEQNEKTFDQLVEGIRKDGFDEPVIVVPIEIGANAGKYMIVSGHHRVKAARVNNYTHIPCVIKKGWDEDKRQIELVRRNMLKGNLNPEKFTKLYNDLVKRGLDQKLIQLQMGFTEKDAFKKVYKAIEKTLTTTQRAKLAEAKETIKSVDGLSGAINKIFTEHGSDLNKGFAVFSYGGKEHHFIECDTELHKLLLELEEKARSAEEPISDMFKSILKKSGMVTVAKTSTVRPFPGRKVT